MKDSSRRATGTRRDSKGEETTAAISVVRRRRTELPDLQHDRQAARAVDEFLMGFSDLPR